MLRAVQTDVVDDERDTARREAAENAAALGREMTDEDECRGTNAVDEDGAVNASALEADASATRTEVAAASFI